MFINRDSSLWICFLLWSCFWNFQKSRSPS